MIIQNGYIETMTLTGGGTDPATGHPVAEAVSWGDPIPCQWYLKRNRQAVLAEGERMEQPSYEILIEEMPHCFHPEQVRLTDLCCRVVGIFAVESVEPLDAVSEVRINVKMR